MLIYFKISFYRTFELICYLIYNFSKRKSPALEVKSPCSAPTSPMVANALTPRGVSTGGDRLRRAVLTDSARRLSGLVSPFVSQMARRSMERPAASNEQPGASPGASKPVRR